MLTMRTLRFGILALLVSGTHGQEQQQARLSTETDGVDGHEMKLVAYITPSDQKSRSLAVEWDTARSKSDFRMEIIDDCPQDQRCPDLAPEAYPVIRLFRGKEQMVDYPGPRTSDEIVKFINRAKQSSQKPKKLTAEEFEAFKNADDFVCIANLEPSETVVRKAFEALSKKYWAEFTFGVIETAEQEPKVVCHKQDDDSTHARSFTEPDGLETWLIEASRPVIAELTPANHQRLLNKRGWPMIYIFSPTPTSRADIRAQLHAFAKSHYSSLTAATVDPAYFPSLPGKLGLSPAEDGYPAGAAHQLSNGRIYPYPKGRGFTPRELQGWGLDVWQGRVKPWAPPGQEAPGEDEGGGNVRVVTSHNVRIKNIPGLKIKIAGRERDEL
ncbi:uncharacterized protein CTRU02_212915 [Colletotrichum truncatum]|uniref:Uncharacterized protein n=1 Tax=Colletotrichum truncatum TaxID=5467 RepID=A0ACC3YJD6_COLTU